MIRAAIPSLSSRAEGPRYPSQVGLARGANGKVYTFDPSGRMNPLPDEYQQDAQSGRHIALGFRQGLRNFAYEIGADTLLSSDDFLNIIRQESNNPFTRFSINLDGFAEYGGNSVMEWIQNVAKSGRYTGDEMALLLTNGRISDAVLYLNGRQVPNPFENYVPTNSK